MSRLLYRLGRSAARHPWRVLAGWLAALVLAGGLAASAGGALNDDYTLPGTGAQRATDLLREKFPAMSGTDARIVVHDTHGPVDGAALAATVDRLRDAPGVSGVQPALRSADGHTALISVQYDVPVTELPDATGMDPLEAAAEPLRSAGHQVEFGGQVAENVQSPDGRAGAVGITAAPRLDPHGAEPAAAPEAVPALEPVH
jgi:RND superfamily putative drug exporter